MMCEPVRRPQFQSIFVDETARTNNTASPHNNDITMDQIGDVDSQLLYLHIRHSATFVAVLQVG